MPRCAVLRSLYRSNEEVQASRELARLRSTYDQIDLDAWVPYLDQAVATATAINALRTPNTNPFTLIIKSLQGVDSTVKDIRDNMLDSLSTTVKNFNGLWHNNASVAFEVREETGASYMYSHVHIACGW